MTLFESEDDDRVTTISNCPYCHNTAKMIKKIRANTRGEHHNYYVACHVCRAREPLEKIEYRAILQWNKISELISLLGKPF